MNTETILQQLAENFVQWAQKAIAEKGTFNVALSGGSSPKQLFQILSKNYTENSIWKNTYFFFGDERYVPSNHADFNGLMARENLLTPLQISENQIFEVNTQLSPEEAANDYWSRIQQHFQTETPVFDLVMLGLGDDAHTASLFPHTQGLKVTDNKVIANFIPKLDTWRITFSYALINHASKIIFLTFGASKAKAVAQIFGTEKDTDTFPAQLIHGNVEWYMDDEAKKLI